MSRWSKEESSALEQMRSRLHQVLSQQTPFPEVVGDRRLLRFYYGNANNVDKAVESYINFLKWRKNNNVDKIRQDILYGKAKSPFQFPNGQKIIKLAPQIILTDNAHDNDMNPIALECYSFSPKEFLEYSNIEEYLVFLTYCLEYRSMMIEQISEMRERKYIAEHPVESDRKDGYGVLVRICHIRDLKGITLAHLGQHGRSIVAAALKLGLPNYPDLLDIGYFINVPWVFNAFFYFVKQFLDETILRKLNMCSSDHMKLLLQQITIDNIPKLLGGKFELYNEPFEFDISPGAPLWYEGAPSPEATIESIVPSPYTNSPMPMIQTPSPNQNDLRNAQENFINSSNNYIQTSIAMTNTSVNNQKRSILSDLLNMIFEQYDLTIFITSVLFYSALFRYDRLLWIIIPIVVGIVFSLDSNDSKV